MVLVGAAADDVEAGIGGATDIGTTADELPADEDDDELENDDGVVATEAQAPAAAATATAAASRSEHIAESSRCHLELVWRAALISAQRSFLQAFVLWSETKL